MPDAEVMGTEFKKTRDFYLEKIRDKGNQNLANILETQTSSKLANQDYIEGLKDIHPEFQAELEGLCDEVQDLQQGEKEAYDWTVYFQNPHNQTKKGFIHGKLAQDIEKDFTFKKLRDSEQIYVFKDGYYQEKGEQIIEEECEKRLGPEYLPKHLKKVKAKIEARNYISRHKFRPPKRKINLENGVYDIETEQLLPHDPKYNFTHKIPVRYDPNSECKKIHKFLEEIVETEEEVKTLREIAGYILLPDYPINKAFMLIGKGSNGKSIYLDLLKQFVGNNNYVNKSLQDIEQNQYATSKLVGSLACFDDDLPSDKLTRTSTLKKLTGGSDIGAEIKYGDQFDFKNIAKFVFACNELPRTNDSTDGFYRRWILVEFPYKFKENPETENPRQKEARPRQEVLKELTEKEELEGFLWWAIEDLKDVLHNNEFTFAPTTEEARQKWREYSTPLAQFIENFIEQGTTWEEAEQKAGQTDDKYAQFFYDYIRKDFLAEVIADYCEHRSHSGPSKREITRELKKCDFYMNERAKTVREPEASEVPVYGGLRMKYPDNPGVEGLNTYSQTLRHACGVKDNSKQSVRVFDPSNLMNEVKKEVQESGEIAYDDLLEKFEDKEDEVEEIIEKLLNEGELFEPKNGVLKVI